MGWWLGDLVHHGIHVACQFRFLFLFKSLMCGFAFGSLGLTSVWCSYLCLCLVS
jgi:hypothetical protein